MTTTNVKDEQPWLADERKITSATLAAHDLDFTIAVNATRFERFERPGEFCMLPWLRVFTSNGNMLEAPLTQVKLLSYWDQGS